MAGRRRYSVFDGRATPTEALGRTWRHRRVPLARDHSRSRSDKAAARLCVVTVVTSKPSAPDAHDLLLHASVAAGVGLLLVSIVSHPAIVHTHRRDLIVLLI